MSVTSMAKLLLPSIISNALRRNATRMPRSSSDQLRFIEEGGIPWSDGYLSYRDAFISAALSDSTLLEIFRQGAPLPHRYGVGTDERCIEYPWLFSRLGSDTKVLLDAGSTFNHSVILEHPLLKSKLLHILTLGPEPSCFWHKGISYLFSDLRDIATRDSYYDAIACISTLEHVGYDNSSITGNSRYREKRPLDYIVAIRELLRVLKPGGRLFVTVPFGKYTDLGIQQQFDSATLNRAIDTFGKTEYLEVTFYRYSADGWTCATERECASCVYVSWIAEAWGTGSWPSPVPLEVDRAAAARAVACIAVRKPLESSRGS